MVGTVTFALVLCCVFAGFAKEPDKNIAIHVLTIDSIWVFSNISQAKRNRDNNFNPKDFPLIPNVCETTDKLCHSNATCTNVSASIVQCQCMSGYLDTSTEKFRPYDLIPTGTNCTDINECLDNNACGVHTNSCYNLPGSYNCTCNTGYMLTKTKKCIKYDPCYYKNCHVGAFCSNDTGSFTCKCRNGYTGNGTTCTDINECANGGVANCGGNATCNNTIGSYTCQCNAGYSGNGITCEDINECANGGMANCSGDATCNNTIGSYTCQCNAGYSGNGFKCEDIDECKELACTDHAICTNTHGSYYCSCQTGYVPECP